MSTTVTENTGLRQFLARRFNNTSGRLQGLDALRGVAALLVVIYHYTCLYPNAIQPFRDPLWLTFPMPALGVQIFFVISGFVIFMTLERCRSGRDFFVSRFARLYPPFVFCMLLTAAVGLWLGFDPRQIDLVDVIGNLPMVVGLLISVAVRTFAGDDLYGRLALAVNFQYAHLFVAGIALYGFSCGKVRVPACLLLAAAIVGGMSHVGAFSIGGTAKILMIAGLIWLGARVSLTGAAATLAGFLGGIAYSLYLLHQMPGFTLIYRLEALGMNANQTKILAAYAPWKAGRKAIYPAASALGRNCRLMSM